MKTALFTSLFLLCVLSLTGPAFSIFAESKNKIRVAYYILMISTVGTWIAGVVLIAQSQPPDDVKFTIAILLLLITLTLFWWGVHTVRSFKGSTFQRAFAREAPTLICQSGPYRWLRHPFYTAYITCYLGLAIYLNNLVTWGAVTIMYVIYWNAAANEERRILASDQADEYIRYSKKAKSIFFGT